MKGTDSYRQLLGSEIVEVRDGYAKTALKITKDHTNALGYTHGGTVFALADCAFAEASNYGEKVAVALQVDIKFLKPSSEGDTLIAEATRISDGKTIGLYHVAIRKGEKTIAFFSGLAYKQ